MVQGLGLRDQELSLKIEGSRFGALGLREPLPFQVQKWTIWEM